MSCKHARRGNPRLGRKIRSVRNPGSSCALSHRTRARKTIFVRSGDEFSENFRQAPVLREDRDRVEFMWRVGIAAAAFLALLAQSAHAAHPARASCGDRGSVLCTLYGPAYGHKLSRAHRAHRFDANARAAVTDPRAHPDPARLLHAASAPDRARPATVLAARIDPLSHGTDAGDGLGAAPRRPVGSGSESWSGLLLIALGAGGILSLFLAKAVEI
jgi:hypothetical protein